MVRQNLWLHRWVDEFDISTAATADKLIKSPVHWARLLELATEHDLEPELPPLPKWSITAGRSLDLTAFLACGHPDCLTGQVDRLFARVWHYFDKIAVVGADSHRVLELEEQHRSVTAQNMIRAMVRVLLHARETGADKFLIFTDKPPACDVHWPEYRDDPSLHLPNEVLVPIAEDLLRTGRITPAKGHCAKCGDDFEYRGRGPSRLRDTVSAARAHKRRLPGMTMNEAVVLIVLERYILGAASDLHASEELGAPIGLGIPFEARLLKSLRPTATEQEIAFNLQLPVVEGLGVKDLVALRESDGDAFDAFRVTLKEAMSVRIKEDGSRDPAEIAAEIQDELLEPSLIEVRRRLKVAEKTLDRKRLGHAVGVTGLSTVCGLLGGPAAILPAVLAGAASAGKAELTAIDQKTDIESDNMYFLWRVDHLVKQKAKSRKKRRR